MNSDGGGIELPQTSEREMFDRLLSEDSERGDSCLLYTSPSPRD